MKRVIRCIVEADIRTAQIGQNRQRKKQLTQEISTQKIPSSTLCSSGPVVWKKEIESWYWHFAWRYPLPGPRPRTGARRPRGGAWTGRGRGTGLVLIVLLLPLLSHFLHFLLCLRPLLGLILAGVQVVLGQVSVFIIIVVVLKRDHVNRVMYCLR